MDQEAYTQYWRIKDSANFGALLRSKRAEANLTIEEVYKTFGLSTSVLSVMERAGQSVFRVDVIEKLRKYMEALSLPAEALEVTQLTQGQWLKHFYPKRRLSKKVPTPKPPKTVPITPPEGWQPPGPPPAVVSNPKALLFDMTVVERVKLLVALSEQGILSDEALQMALRDLLNKEVQR